MIENKFTLISVKHCIVVPGNQYASNNGDKTRVLKRAKWCFGDSNSLMSSYSLHLSLISLGCLEK